MTEKQLQYQREYRKRTNNSTTHRYEKTPRGFLMRVYRNMKSRVSGIQKKKAHLYKGKTLLSKELFYEWAINNYDFRYLFKEWTIKNYPRKICPSINRIDSSLGYELGNMEWITHSKNSKLGGLSIKRSQ